MFADSWPHCEMTQPGCHVTILTAKSVCIEARSWSDAVGGAADRQTDRGGLCVSTGYPGFYSPVIPPLLLLSFYLAMSHPLIDGLLVLPSDRKLAFVCLSVRELKEVALLTDVYEGTSSLCVCVCACMCHC